VKSKCPSFCIALTVLLFEFSALASTTRVRSMGDVGLILRDDSNIWLFPSTTVQYANLALLELGGRPELLYYLPAQVGFDPAGGGLVGFGPGRRHVIGAFVGESSELMPLVPPNPTTGPSIRMDRKIDLFYALKGRQASAGCRLTYARGSYKSSQTRSLREPPVVNEAWAQVMDLALGVTRSVIQDGILDITVGYVNHTFEVTHWIIASQRPKPRGGHHFELLGRWTKKLMERVDMVPFAGGAIGSEGRETPADIGGRIEDLAQSRLLAGVGLNFRPDSGSVFSLALSVLRTQETTTTKVLGQSRTKHKLVTFRLPFVFGGAETALFDWLRVRFGFQKALQTVNRETKVTYEGSPSADTQSEDQRSDGPFEFTFGLRIHHRGLTIDLSLDPDYFKRGVYALSGSSGKMFNLVTMTYAFE